MRIALAVEGTRGDVHPMLDLGRAFQQLGHEVVLCGPSNFRDEARSRGVDFREIGCDTRAFLDEFARSVPSRGLEALRAQRRYFADSIRMQFERLPEATRNADVILGAGVQIAGSSAAQLHGVPYRYIAYCPVMFPSPEHAPAFLPNQNLPRWLNRITWAIALYLTDPLLRIPINRERRKLGLPPIRNAMFHALGDATLLAADPVLAPVPRETRLEVESIGCLHAHRPGPLPEKLEAFLGAGPPPLYVGFGSMTDADPAATTRLTLNAIEVAGCRAIVSEGWAGLGTGPLPEHVIRIGPLPHESLFPRCGAIAHHGGAGTSTRAAQAGVPQIVIPHLLDQYWWGRRLHALGLSPPPLPRSGLDAETLATSITAALEDEFLSQRAREIGATIAPPALPLAAAQRILANLANLAK